jgi:2-polyprenyl-3-methyl-5-hydroxy-6-metoxy-1,4-benzoquinol methylase
MTTPLIFDHRFIIKNMAVRKDDLLPRVPLRYAALMSTATEHYAHHLGPVYSWMAGNLEVASARAIAELDALGLPALAHGAAIDLGAGFDLHSLPLARRGFTVTAIDSCQTLINELQGRAVGMPIDPVVADILDFRKYASKPVEVILCMGDTLTHLPERASVEHLLADVAASLTRTGYSLASSSMTRAR